MLLKKLKKGFHLLTPRKNNDKPANALPLGKKGRFGFTGYAAFVCCLCFGYTTAAAAGDPLEAVNNLSGFIFSLIRAIGLILLGWGVVQVGLSFQSHDPSQRSQGFLTLAGGLVVTFTKEILDLITGV
ncbi:glutamyl-tRNA amidotransferase [Massiliimalia timonensis]|uniref:glutamyl-tRNA amidotransferase n=1 Tax=Massiliimalia timonensis TaxID=1987501 RepID=UPI00193A480C|nr:glutamyl-tRNA amidotransferase [Massiliimalia timonensis]